MTHESSWTHQQTYTQVKVLWAAASVGVVGAPIFMALRSGRIRNSSWVGMQHINTMIHLGVFARQGTPILVD